MASVAGSPVRPHSVSPKCTSLAVAMVASSRPAAAPSVRTSAGSHVVGRHALDRERRTRCRARGRSTRATWYGPVVVDLVVADTRRDGSPGVARERDHDLVGARRS